MHPFLFLENSYLPPHVTYSIFTIILLSLLSFLATRRLEVYPGSLQNVMETIIGGFDTLVTDTMGHHGRTYFPLIATIGLFILTSNLIGIIPGFESPTASINVTCSMALVVFFATHAVGVKTHGLKYFKTIPGAGLVADSADDAH